MMRREEWISSDESPCSICRFTLSTKESVPNLDKSADWSSETKSNQNHTRSTYTLLGGRSDLLVQLGDFVALLHANAELVLDLHC